MAVQSYYNTNTITTTNSSLNDVLNSLATSLVATPTGGAEGTLSGFTSSSGPVYSALNSFLPAKDPAPPSGYPKAYLNWIFLDDQFNYVSSSSGSVPAASSTYPAATLNTVAPGSPISIPKNGYIYVWASNETQGWDVFFDNLSVQYKQGAVLEENHYYPFGLSMAGISDKAIKNQYAENKYRYNGKELQNKEFSDGTGLEEYDFGLRFQDPQLGVWHNADPLAGMSMRWSPYAYVNDNPVMFTDPNGAYPAGAGGPFGKYMSMNYGRDVNGFGDDGGGGGGGGGGGAGGGGGIGSVGVAGGGGAGQGGGMYMGDGTFISPDGQVMNYEEAVNYITGIYPGLVSSVNPTVTESAAGSKTYYNYSTSNGQYSFETPNDHGASTYQDDDMYYFQGTTVKNIANISVSYDVSGAGDMSGWDMAGKIDETLGVTFESTEQGVIGAQKLANWASGTTNEILKAGKMGKVAGVTLGGINMLMTIGDGLTNENGWQNHHTADLVVSTVEIGLGIFEATSPIGWAFGAVMFVGNLVSEYETGKTITQNLFDK